MNQTDCSFRVTKGSIDEIDTDEPREAVELNFAGNDLNAYLPPIDNVGDAFKDILQRVLDNKEGSFPDLWRIAASGGFTFNVGTMCSGTEAPIFALKLVQTEVFAITGMELFRFNQEHAVEISPSKQAYIRRNTNATVFRDVRPFASRHVLSTAQ